MAAALGLAASVIAVLQLTGATISACLSYGSGVKNASRDKKIIIDRLFGPKTSSRLPALNELLLRCGGELESLT
ncbi:hypothetical protein JB92DRAFT_83550 [Gautieria morchelliformis]|nr:hypothetical protein JB92DRAFT_83550 [Gautieria morchelliformis]